MEKIAFCYTLSEEQKARKKQKVERLLKNPYLRAWMKEYQVDESFVYDHSGKLADYCEMKEKCENCKGLDFCRQPSRGNRLDLHWDGLLQNQLINCNFQQEEIEKTKHQQFFIERDMADAYLDIDLAQNDMAKETKEYAAAFAKVIKLMMNGNTQKGCYLWGKPGAGKTYLAAGLSNYYAKQKKRVAFVNVPKLAAELKMMFHDAEAMERRLNRIKFADIVVLDDIGGESITAWSRDDMLLPLLDARMEKHRLTIFTSNYSMDELKERLRITSNGSSEPVAAERLLERIQALSCEIFVKGNSRRK